MTQVAASPRPKTIAAERANIRFVLEGWNAVEPMMTAERARKQTNTRTLLNDSQRRIIEEVLNEAGIDATTLQASLRVVKSIRARSN